MRRAVAGETTAEEPADAEGEESSTAIQLSSERYVEMSAQEQVVLTVSVNGYGKRTSSYEYRTTGRGGKGIVAMSVNNRNGKLVASFPVEHSDQIMLVTDKGQLIRCPVEDIRIAGRSTRASSCSIPPRMSTWCRSSTSATTGKTARTGTAASTALMVRSAPRRASRTMAPGPYPSRRRKRGS